MEFDGNGAPVGALITNYLLEKVRHSLGLDLTGRQPSTGACGRPDPR
jgi:hypothetical protein